MADTAVTPLDIWNELRKQGASAVQAAGLMGNAMSESSLDPESNAQDSNGYMSYGLFQWNAQSYPQAASLVTGNPKSDLRSQVAYLGQTGGFAAAQGATPADVAANFAHTWERCAACGYQDGSNELTVRAQNADTVWAAAHSGDWASLGNVSGAAGIGAAGAMAGGVGATGNVSGAAGIGAAGAMAGGVGATGTVPTGMFDPNKPVWQLHLGPLGDVTIVRAGQLRHIEAVALIGVGGLVMVAGLGVLLAAGLGKVNPVAQIATGVIRGSQARRASSRRISETRAKEEIRTEGAVTRAEGTASARRYGRDRGTSVPADEEPFFPEPAAT